MLKKDLKPNASSNQMVFILGDPGSGKSTLMLHLAYWYCKFLDGFDEFVVLQEKQEDAALEELLSLLLGDKSNVFRINIHIQP